MEELIASIIISLCGIKGNITDANSYCVDYYVNCLVDNSGVNMSKLNKCVEVWDGKRRTN